ncbi:MAG: hypothetical protein ABIQ31_14895 [Ferruginibacter sp.]
MKKKIITTSIIAFTFYAAKAQDDFNPFKDRQLIFDVVNICAVLIVIYAISSFILRIVKQIFDYRLKNKMIEKETTEIIVAQLLQPDRKEIKSVLLQWFFILAGIGVGFTIINYMPFGLHSLAIMAFSIATGFLGSYFFTRQRSQ